MFCFCWSNVLFVRLFCFAGGYQPDVLVFLANRLKRGPEKGSVEPNIMNSLENDEDLATKVVVLFVFVCVCFGFVCVCLLSIFICVCFVVCVCYPSIRLCSMWQIRVKQFPSSRDS